MSFALLFWILMLFWLIYSGWGWYRPMAGYWYGHGIFFFVLFVLLGWRVFGQPLHP